MINPSIQSSMLCSLCYTITPSQFAWSWVKSFGHLLIGSAGVLVHGGLG